MPLLPEHDASSGRLRFRKVETIVQAALEQYRTTGYNEISLLSLSTSDYPEFDELMRRLQETFRPLGVSVSLPSLRINEQLRFVGRSDEHRPPFGPDLGARGRPRRHAAADRQADHATTTCTPAAAGRSRTVFRG